jgi:hypothetical protein
VPSVLTLQQHPSSRALLHPTVAHLGASPDGITPYGVMVEIKCPYSKTLKDIPEEYWAQMQGQLEVTG